MADSCDYCGQPVVWVYTVAGGSIPLDPGELPGGEMVLVDYLGRLVLPGAEVDADDMRARAAFPRAGGDPPDGAARYRCHLESCPAAPLARRVAAGRRVAERLSPALAARRARERAAAAAAARHHGR